MTKKDIEIAFTLGFMVSREGFNGECDYSHCAPGGLQADCGYGINEFIGYIGGNDTFIELRRQAVEYIDRMNAVQAPKNN